MTEFWIIGGALALYWIIMIPIQYRNIAATKEELQKTSQTHNEKYEEMEFEEQQMQFNLQGNLFNLPATLVAQFIYFLSHLGKSK